MRARESDMDIAISRSDLFFLIFIFNDDACLCIYKHGKKRGKCLLVRSSEYSCGSLIRMMFLKPVHGIRDVMQPVCVLNWFVGSGAIEIPRGQFWRKLSFFYAFAVSVIIFAMCWYKAEFLSNRIDKHSGSGTSLWVYAFIIASNFATALVAAIYGQLEFKVVTEEINFFNHVTLIVKKH